MVLCRFLGGDGTEELALYRVSGHLYTVSFDSNLGDLEVSQSCASSKHPQLCVQIALPLAPDIMTLNTAGAAPAEKLYQVSP